MAPKKALTKAHLPAQPGMAMHGCRGKSAGVRKSLNPTLRLTTLPLCGKTDFVHVMMAPKSTPTKAHQTACTCYDGSAESSDESTSVTKARQDKSESGDHLNDECLFTSTKPCLCLAEGVRHACLGTIMLMCLHAGQAICMSCLLGAAFVLYTLLTRCRWCIW